MSKHNIDDLVIIAIGGNLPSRASSVMETLEQALNQFPSKGLKIVKRSRWWRSKAWPDKAAPDYINGVVIVETPYDPLELLGVLSALEEAFGRQRTTANAPRVLDLDLIAYGRVQLETATLTLPHPRANDRLFVMGPLSELEPNWRCPRTGVRASQLAADAPIGRDAHAI